MLSLAESPFNENSIINEAYFKPIAAKDLRYVNCTKSWQEQRMFTYLSVEALGNHSVVQDVVRELKQTRPSRPDLDGK